MSLPPVCFQKNIALAAGRLKVTVSRSDWPLDDLCGFAARHNPARGYLFVSKVLGKHYPVRPSVMKAVHDRLAEKLLALDITGPTAVISLAETATGLGQGIFEAGQEKRPDSPWLFLHTTRYALGRPAAFQLTEEHCHAPEHLVYEPVSPEGRDIFYSARTLVLIDDEVSTGRTFMNLANAFAQKATGLERLVLVAIKCWLDDRRRDELTTRFARPVDFVSLLDGSFEFYAAPVGQTERPMFKSVGNWTPKDEFLPCNFGRLGLTADDCRKDRRRSLNSLTGSLALDRARPVLVLGTGEFLHQPYLLARRLEEDGFDVHFQSTTRTPIAVGRDIEHVLRFVDNYHDGIDNFLYNVWPDSDSQKILCYETARLPADHKLPELLKARIVFFSEAWA